jgi:tetratricopeptide (TPR) repeat protein
VRKYREDYFTIFWVEAGQKESIERDYLQIHRLLFDPTSVTRPDVVSIEDAVVAVKRWFYGRTERSLLVLDSADAIDDSDDESCINLAFFMPDAPTVDIIVTTRYAGAAEMATLTPVEVGEMAPTEAAELFQKCAKLKSPRPGVETEVLQIVEELGRLALAITLAGSYVAATPRLRSDIHLYLPEYRERRKQLLGMKATKLIHRYGESVLSTWETSFAAVERQSVMAARLLSLLAFLNFDDIFPTLFKRPAGEEKPRAVVREGPNRQWQSYVLIDGSADQYAIEAAFRVLQIYSLVQWQGDRGGYAMHKLVHAWGQDRLKVEQQRYLSLMALELLANIIPSATGNSTFGMRLVPHIMANFTVVSSTNTTSATIDDESLESIAIVGNLLRGLGRWSDEHEIRVFHFEKTCESAGTEHPSTLTSMGDLAEVLSYQGKYEQAEEMHRQELGLRETVLGKEHPDTLTSMNNLAAVLINQGKYEQAEEMYRQILRLAKEYPGILTSIDNLANVLEYRGKYEQAEEMHRQMLELRKMVLGKEHPSTLTSMNNLATVLILQGKYERAGEIFRQTLELKEAVLGKEHPSTLISMNNLAEVLSHQGKYEQAEEMHRQILELGKRVLGKEHPSTLTSMNNLANVLKKQGKYEQAEEIHRQALRLMETVLGKEHPNTLKSMNNLANVLKYRGKYEQAEEMHRQALGPSEAVLGKEHPDTLANVLCLAHLLYLQRRLNEARPLYRRALTGYDKTLGSNHSTTQACRKSYLSIFKGMDELDTDV